MQTLILFLIVNTCLVHFSKTSFWIPAVLLDHSEDLPIFQHLCFSLGQETHISERWPKLTQLEKETVIHSSILAWRIPWTEKHGGIQSMGLPRVGRDWVTSIHTPTSLLRWILVCFGMWFSPNLVRHFSLILEEVQICLFSRTQLVFPLP